jgi:hypothetical protein
VCSVPPQHFPRLIAKGRVCLDAEATTIEEDKNVASIAEEKKEE